MLLTIKKSKQFKSRIFLSKQNYKMIYGLIVVLFLPPEAWTATLAIGNETVSGPNIAVTVPIFLSPHTGEQVSAIQFDLLFDETAMSFTTATAGESALAAGKYLSFNILEAGVVRVVIAGLNLDAISEGIIAYLEFTTLTGVSPGIYNLLAEGVRISNPFGLSVSVTTLPGSITVEPLPVWNLAYRAMPTTGGNVDGPANISRMPGATVTIAVTPNSGYLLENVTADNDAVITEHEPYTLSNVTAHTIITAFFTLQGPYEGEGEYSSEGEHISEGESETEGEYMTEGESETEGEYITEGESETEGEYITEGESENEGEYITEGESENEGEYITEGESETEGEYITEGENEGERLYEGETVHEGEYSWEGEHVPEGEHVGEGESGNRPWGCAGCEYTTGYKNKREILPSSLEFLIEWLLISMSCIALITFDKHT